MAPITVAVSAIQAAATVVPEPIAAARRAQDASLDGYFPSVMELFKGMLGVIWVVFWAILSLMVIAFILVLVGIMVQRAFVALWTWYDERKKRREEAAADATAEGVTEPLSLWSRTKVYFKGWTGTKRENDGVGEGESMWNRMATWAECGRGYTRLPVAEELVLVEARSGGRRVGL
ncbi:hypothetical protein FA95DRAFT_1557031 [Auriscalpium vulgare]|uniref:Uncharacterized protein n=1 Tax=Auriscalpium vulgare TaxID=40419 RepID=A0ACB8RZ47_9AGAM|nr:hypothetical protein FA95DRAFT_1557031 [Auriscalpium vulgare]